MLIIGSLIAMMVGHGWNDGNGCDWGLLEADCGDWGTYQYDDYEQFDRAEKAGEPMIELISCEACLPETHDQGNCI